MTSQPTNGADVPNAAAFPGCDPPTLIRMLQQCLSQNDIAQEQQIVTFIHTLNGAALPQAPGIHSRRHQFQAQQARLQLFNVVLHAASHHGWRPEVKVPKLARIVAGLEQAPGSCFPMDRVTDMVLRCFQSRAARDEEGKMISLQHYALFAWELQKHEPPLVDRALINYQQLMQTLAREDASTNYQQIQPQLAVPTMAKPKQGAGQQPGKANAKATRVASEPGQQSSPSLPGNTTTAAGTSSPIRQIVQEQLQKQYRDSPMMAGQSKGLAEIQAAQVTIEQRAQDYLTPEQQRNRSLSRYQQAHQSIQHGMNHLPDPLPHSPQPPQRAIAPAPCTDGNGNSVAAYKRSLAQGDDGPATGYTQQQQQAPKRAKTEANSGVTENNQVSTKFHTADPNNPENFPYTGEFIGTEDEYKEFTSELDDVLGLPHSNGQDKDIW